MGLDVGRDCRCGHNARALEGRLPFEMSEQVCVYDHENLTAVNPLRVPVSVPARSDPEDNLQQTVLNEGFLQWYDSNGYLQHVDDAGSPEQRGARRGLG